jgi:hypothetical protein
MNFKLLNLKTTFTAILLTLLFQHQPPLIREALIRPCGHVHIAHHALCLWFLGGTIRSS